MSPLPLREGRPLQLDGVGADYKPQPVIPPGKYWLVDPWTALPMHVWEQLSATMGIQYTRKKIPPATFKRDVINEAGLYRKLWHIADHCTFIMLERRWSAPGYSIKASFHKKKLKCRSQAQGQIAAMMLLELPCGITPAESVPIEIVEPTTLVCQQHIGYRYEFYGFRGQHVLGGVTIS